jgi:UDPglucose 6-dehydrogenase
MKISIIGTGYVGLTTGTCLAETGNDVMCIDCDADKIQNLNKGIMPIYEPGLEELVRSNRKANRLHFTTSLEKVGESDAIFIAVGTPTDEAGVADMRVFWVVVDQLAPYLKSGNIVVIKSTVPVGTHAKTMERIQKFTKQEVAVVSNPEFLKEGMAIEDCMKPDRVVIGTRQSWAGLAMQELYAPYLRTGKPLLSLSPESAEMTKYVANCFLATKISFINEMANICTELGADINEVRAGIGHDSRIGFSFLHPGCGYGGSCFPKDIYALASMASGAGVAPHILKAVQATNAKQKQLLADMVWRHFGRLTGKTFALWGLAFKPGTDDIREAPALAFIDRMLDAGAYLRVHDPVAMDNVKRIYGDKLVYCESPMGALREVDGLVIATEWKSFITPDFSAMRDLMKGHIIFDGRNIFKPMQVHRQGFIYYSIGQQL